MTTTAIPWVAARFLGDVRRANEMMRRYDRLLGGQRSGVSAASVAVLFALLQRGDSAPIHEVADAVGITANSATSLVDRMERDGFVVREANPADRRSLLLRILPKGTSAAVEALEKLDAK